MLLRETSHVIQNKGIINTTDAQELMMANSGAQVVNAGVINIRPDAESHTVLCWNDGKSDDSRAKNAWRDNQSDIHYPAFLAAEDLVARSNGITTRGLCLVGQ